MQIRGFSQNRREQLFPETGLPVLGILGSSEGAEGTESELLNGEAVIRWLLPQPGLSGPPEGWSAGTPTPFL